MPKFLKAKEAAALIQDGSTVALCGMGVSCCPEDVVRAIESRFLEEGAPRNLTLMYGAHVGNKDMTHGAIHFGHEGLVTKWITAFPGPSLSLYKLGEQEKLEGYVLPLGVILQLYAEIAGKRPGLITKIGLQTYADPRLEGCKLNRISNEEVVKLIELEGEEWLLYKSRPIDVALIRGTVADQDGNLTMDEESLLSEALSLAQATKNSGGIVIAQVKYSAQNGSLHPKAVKVPGILVDYVVINEDPECHCQTEEHMYNPAFCGAIRADLKAIPRLVMGPPKVILRRGAMEIKKGDCVNMGYGIPMGLTSLMLEEGVENYMKVSSEAGTVGGVAHTGKAFGNVWNPACLIEQNLMFNWYDGGALDTVFLGLAETDRFGNVNVSKFNGRVNGPGGFINITQTAKKVIYCGTFTAGKQDIRIEDGKVNIVQDGKYLKFVKDVEQITFSGKYASQSGQDVFYVTERAVFHLRDAHMELIEIAPGVDLKRDILDKMEFEPVISPDLKVMDPAMFSENWGKLKDVLDQKEGE